MADFALTKTMADGVETSAISTTGITTETLLRTSASWNNVSYEPYAAGVPEIVVRKITIPAHGVLRWHEHPMPTAAYVLSGEITVEEPDGQMEGRKQRFTAGQVIPEPVNTVHRGVVGDAEAIFIVFYAGVKEMPLSKGT